jgi:protein involved in polysaccharide export with SLBB domain
MRILRNKIHIFPPARRSVLALCLISGLLFCAPVLGQRAEREAEQQVSFSAETIIGLLRTEPGLFLQVKRLLVQKAYEQGRILDPGDLTDDAVFRLLRADNALRILATHEIEIRSYIRPKPTQQELERDRSLPTSGQGAGLPMRGEKNQESVYWSRLESDSPSNAAPSSSDSSPPAEQNRDELPPRRLPPVDRTQAEPLQDNPFEIPDSKNDAKNDAKNNAEMSAVRPEELPALLNASDMAQPRRAPVPAKVPTTQYSLSADRSNLYDRQVGIRHDPNPYASVPSLYDLYTQVSPRQPVLERFAAEVFRNGTGNSDDLPMDLPVGPDYVLGPGDGLSINLWGSVDQRLRRVVDRGGLVALPEVGTLLVAGHNLGEVQQLVQAALRTQFRDVKADVSLARLRTVRVYVVGDVERPGAYDISSLSTPLNAIFSSGGPTGRGSLRALKHYRGQKLVQVIDAYDLLLHGVHGDLERLQPGDTILVPPIGALVTVQGMVRRPAIYELNEEKGLDEVLDLAGGVMSSGTLRHIEVERVEAHERRTMLRLDLPETNDSVAVAQALQAFHVQDGDIIRISPILPYSEQTVYLDGHVFHPGRYAYREGMKVTDLVKSYSDLLPEPAERHAEIIRLNPPDYRPAVLAFSLSDALAGKAQNLILKPFDTVRIFGRFDFEDAPVITVNGEVRNPGDHLTTGTIHLRDAVHLAGGVTPDARLDDVQVFRRTAEGKLRVLSVNLGKALAGDEADNVLLELQDRVFVHRSPAKADPPTVLIQGEVARPGKYPLGEGMTASELVRLAGGLKRSAFTENADLARYLSVGGQQALGQYRGVEIARALAGEASAEVALHDGDVLTIRQLPGWNDIGAIISVQGEVVHPGDYGIREGERLSSILARAGGLRSDAYSYGAILERVQVREIEERTRGELLQRVHAEGATLKLIADTDEDQKMAKGAALLQWQSTLERLENTPPAGRLVIRIGRDLQRWANTPGDIEVRAGDVLVIPKKPNFVMVEGAVYHPTAVAYRPGKSAGWYLHQAGGPTNTASKKATFAIRADGSVDGGSGGWFSGGVKSTALQPGDMLVVPEKAYSGTTRWKSTLQAAQLASAAGIALQIARSF